MRKLSDTPIWLRLTGAIWLMLVIAWGGMIAWETQVNRETAIDQAQDFANSIHEMTMAGLTGMMITGTVGQREVFLDQIKQLDTIRDLHVSRSAAVEQLFGPDTKSSRQRDPLEQRVLQSGSRTVRLNRRREPASCTSSRRSWRRRTISARTASPAIRCPSAAFSA